MKDFLLKKKQISLFFLIWSYGTKSFSINKEKYSIEKVGCSVFTFFF